MKAKVIVAIMTVFLLVTVFYTTNVASPKLDDFPIPKAELECAEEAPEPKHCVFKTVFGEEPLDTAFLHAPDNAVIRSTKEGLQWLKSAQHKDGGWGAGYRHNQREMNPHAVEPDPATTAMVAMALLRTGSTLTDGEYSEELKKATDFLLKAADFSSADGSNITHLTGTQIQGKLGANIDLVLTTQFFSNLMEVLDEESDLYERVYHLLNKCVDKIQLAQDENGRIIGAGWAGVLQSSFANTALEAAQYRGAWVDSTKLEKSRDYQKGNFDINSQSVSAMDGAGVVLYAVSGSTRAAAKEARKAETLIEEAKVAGELTDDDQVSLENLVKAGIEEEQALKYFSSFQVYESAKNVAQDKKVTTGFGNNGGEEFLSFLQTGESMVINKDYAWKKWFDNVSGQLVGIQNKDGSWNGHHCITSPVFCTATCVLLLSINNDIEQLVAMGK